MKPIDLTTMTELTTSQAATLLKVSVRSVQLWVERGVLQAWKTAGGHRRISVASVQQLLHEQQQKKTPLRKTRSKSSVIKPIDLTTMTELTTRQAATLLKVSVRSVQLRVDRGVLQAWKTAGGHRRISVASVQQLLHEKQQKNPPLRKTHSKSSIIIRRQLTWPVSDN